MDSLVGGQNIPTVLQSLGCLAQYSVSTFESQDGEITPCIYQKIFQVIDICCEIDMNSLYLNFVACQNVVGFITKICKLFV